MYPKKLQKPIRRIARRDFLNMTALGVLGASIFPWKNLGATTLPVEPAKIGLQLYTVRNQIEQNINDTLQKVSEFGFEGVETAFWPKDISVKQAGKYLKDAGLTVLSAHIELPVGDEKNKMLEVAETFNCKK